jgi:hypothetical protein
MKHNQTEKSIIKALRRYYLLNKVSFRLHNAYIFKDDWESDFFVLTKSGYAVEFEIKVSRADFKADKLKTAKHSILQHGYYDKKVFQSMYWHPESGKWVKPDPVYTQKEHKNRPHKFYYVVPSGLLASSEVPKYAGLICINPNGSLEIVKPAPLIHKEPLDLTLKLLTRFFYKYENVLAEYGLEIN